MTNNQDQQPEYNQAIAAIADTLDDGSFDSVLVVVTYRDGDNATQMEYARRGNDFANIAAAGAICDNMKSELDESYDLEFEDDDE